MKKILMACLFALISSASISAQTVIWKDDFDGDKGWQTFEYKGLYKSEYTKDGALLLKGYNKGTKCTSKCKTTLNPIKNFSISVEATSKSGLKEDSYFGIAFNCLDANNYSLFSVEKGFAYYEQYRDGQRVRFDYDLIKNTKVKVFNLEIKKTGTTVAFLINDEETLFIEDVEVKSSKVALYVEGETQVAFDNIEIKQ